MKKIVWPSDWMILSWIFLCLALMAIVGCECQGNGCDFPTKPSIPEFYSNNEFIQVVWRGPDQVEILWDDMPITAVGGSEAYVWRRSAWIQLPEPREVIVGDGFMGFDRGDVVEAELSIYDGQGRSVYRRSLHKEEGSPESYEAYWPLPYNGPASDRYNIDLSCRVNGKNQFGELTARCHFSALITFRPKGQQQVSTGGCYIPSADDPSWGRPFRGTPVKKDVIEAAKARIENPCGEHPDHTLALLAQELRNLGECAEGPFVDAVMIDIGNKFYEEWHSVEYKHGCWTGHRAYRNTWRYKG